MNVVVHAATGDALATRFRALAKKTYGSDWRFVIWHLEREAVVVGLRSGDLATRPRIAHVQTGHAFICHGSIDAAVRELRVLFPGLAWNCIVNEDVDWAE